MEEKIFAEGIRADKPNEKAPSFVVAELYITDELFGFIAKHKDARGGTPLTLKESKGGKLYLELNSFRMNRPPEPVKEPVVEDYPVNDLGEPPF